MDAQDSQGPKLGVLVEDSSPFPTFGPSLSSLLQPLGGPSCLFVDDSFSAFADNRQLFRVSLASRKARLTRSRESPGHSR